MLCNVMKRDVSGNYVHLGVAVDLVYCICKGVVVGIVYVGFTSAFSKVQMFDSPFVIGSTGNITP